MQELSIEEVVSSPYLFEDLLRVFYDKNTTKKSELPKKNRANFKRRGREPISPLVYNPAGFTHSRVLDREIAVAVYYSKFAVKIEAGSHYSKGPHAAFLLFQLGRGELIHIATVQLECSFFDEVSVLLELEKVIGNKEFFLNPAMATRVVNVPLDILPEL